MKWCRLASFALFVSGIMLLGLSQSARVGADDAVPCPDQEIVSFLCNDGIMPACSAPVQYQPPGSFFPSYSCNGEGGANRANAGFDQFKTKTAKDKKTVSNGEKECYLMYPCKMGHDDNGARICKPDTSKPGTIAGTKHTWKTVDCDANEKQLRDAKAVDKPIDNFME
ncbi:MAG: hypothetical protein ACRC8S_04275 [Fimbriiglobus sp.]